MGLFGFYTIPLIYVSVLMPVPDCFDYTDPVIQFDIRYCDSFVFLLQNCCSYLGVFMVPHKFLKYFSISVKYGIGILIGIVLNFFFNL